MTNSFLKRLDPIAPLIRQSMRPFGVEVRPFGPDAGIDAYLWQLFREQSINCVLDVGARHGEYGTFLRRNAFKGHIISFEPVSSNFVHLQQASAADPLWDVYPFALGQETNQMSINVSTSTNYSSFLTPSSYGHEYYPGIEAATNEEVAVRRLDELFEEVTKSIANPRVYLKMDTQGWDLEVFRGARGCLSSILALQSEMSLQPLYTDMPNWTAAIAEFEKAGFAISGLFAVVRDGRGRLSEVDCVMIQV